MPKFYKVGSTLYNLLLSDDSEKYDCECTQDSQNAGKQHSWETREHTQDHPDQCSQAVQNRAQNIRDAGRISWRGTQGPLWDDKDAFYIP